MWDGYKAISLQSADGPKTCRVHRLVCAAFYGPQPSAEHEVGHRDGSRDNNDARNLRWITKTYNAFERSLHRRTARGSTQGRAKLTEEQAREILSLARSGVTQRHIARRYQVSQTTVWFIANRVSWTHI